MITNNMNDTPSINNFSLDALSISEDNPAISPAAEQIVKMLLGVRAKIEEFVITEDGVSFPLDRDTILRFFPENIQRLFKYANFDLAVETTIMSGVGQTGLVAIGFDPTILSTHYNSSAPFHYSIEQTPSRALNLHYTVLSLGNTHHTRMIIPSPVCTPLARLDKNYFYASYQITPLTSLEGTNAQVIVHVSLVNVRVGGYSANLPDG